MADDHNHWYAPKIFGCERCGSFQGSLVRVGASGVQSVCMVCNPHVQLPLASFWDEAVEGHARMVARVEACAPTYTTQLEMNFDDN